jgi:hypothetical protein
MSQLMHPSKAAQTTAKEAQLEKKRVMVLKKLSANNNGSGGMGVLVL